jgi:hypothetical protein
MDSDSQEKSRLETALGIPANPHVGPEWASDDFQPEDWTYRVFPNPSKGLVTPQEPS